MTTTQIILSVGGGGLRTGLYENLSVSLRQDGVALHGEEVGNGPMNPRGNFRYLAEDAIGATFEATLTIHSPFVRDARGRPTTATMVPFDLGTIRQRFTLTRAGEPTPVPQAHPLVEFPPSTGTAAGAVVRVLFLTTVLDVTSLYLATRREAVHRDLFFDVDEHIETVDGRPCFKTRDFAGCRVRLLAAANGRVHWLVAPPAVTADLSQVSLVRLYVERDRPYRSLFDVNLASTMRYLASTWDCGSIREHGSTIPTLEPDGYRGFLRPAHRQDLHDPLRLSEYDASNFTPAAAEFPPLRLCEQLARSGRKTLLMIGVPTGAVVDHPHASESSQDRRVYQMVVGFAQWTGLVGQADGAHVRLDKLVAAAHGAAAPFVVHHFDDNRDDYDELWLFDPEHIGRVWPRLAHPGRAKIRLIGGDSHPFLLAHMDSIGAAGPADAMVHTLPTHVGDVTVWPRTAAFWARSRAYSRAFRFLEWDEASQSIVERERPLTVLTPEALARHLAEGHAAAPIEFDERVSRETGLVEIRPEGAMPDDITVAGVRRNGGWLHARRMPGMCLDQIISAHASLTIDRAASEASFVRGLESAIEPASIFRREWSLLGWQAVSDGTEEREEDYKSYFELCLHFSGIEAGQAASPSEPVVRLPSLPEHVRSVPMRTHATPAPQHGPPVHLPSLPEHVRSVPMRTHAGAANPGPGGGGPDEGTGER